MKKNINILDFMNKIPAGTMLIPLAIAMIINTIAQATIGKPLWDVLGNPCKDLFGKSGQMLFVGLSLFFTGTMVSPKDFKIFGKRGIWIVLARIIPAYAACFIFYLLFGLDGILGINFITFTVAMTSVNAALFLATTMKYADTSDTAMYPVLLLLMQPLIPFLIISTFGTNPASESAIMDKLLQFVSLAVPFLLGFILGNLDTKMRDLYAKGNAMIMMFLGIQFGSCMNLLDLFNPTILLAAVIVILSFYILTAICPMLVEKLVLKRPGYDAAGMLSVAGLCLIIPAMFEGWNFGGASATAELIINSNSVLAIVLLITNLTVPFIQKLVMGQYFKHTSREDALGIFGVTHPELIEENYTKEETNE